MGKIKAIWELFDEISHEVTQSSEAWQDYLKFASRIYKYNFDNALQIYGQNREATMLAEQEIWENRIGRTVNAEHTKIAVFDVMSAKPQLRHLIDVSDTKGDEKTYPRLWRLTPENSEPLLARLKESRHPDADSLEAYISLEAMRRVSEIRPGFYEGIKRNTQGSPLYEIETDEELKSKVDVMIWQSSLYMMYSRCGFDTSGLDGRFEDISDYNNKALLYRMGNCATIIAQDFLSECATTLNQLAKERREKAIQEKNNIEPKPEPPVSVKRSISANIRKGARKNIEADSAQLSLFGAEQEIKPETENEEKEPENNVDIDEIIIAKIVEQGSLSDESHKRIYEFFENNVKWNDRAEFLKNVYGVRGSGVDVNGIYFSWMSDSKGIEYHELKGDRKDEKRITWNNFAKYVQDAINEGRYYTPETQAVEETEEQPETIKPKFKYGDFISYKGKVYEVLDSNEEAQETDIGNTEFYVSPHTYILVEGVSWEELNTAELAQPPENVIPEIHVDDRVEYQNRKYKITRIDEDHVHLLDITYDGNIHPQLWSSKSTFIEAPIPDIQEALRNTNFERTYTKEEFLNCEIEMLSKEYDGRTFYFPYAMVHSGRFLLNFAPKEEWAEQDLADGRKNAYKDYLMDFLGYTHKEALAEAEIMSEDEYDEHYSANKKIYVDDEFSIADRRYAVLNFDENKQEVLVRDITNDYEENLPLYEIFDIPFVYSRTRAINNLRNVELHDFLNAPVEFVNVTFGEGDEESVYTYGYMYLKDAVIYMDYTVDNEEWTEKEVELAQRKAYRNYLNDVMGYSEREANIISGVMTGEEYDKVSEAFTPVPTIPHADEVINAPAELLEATDESGELKFNGEIKPKSLEEIKTEAILIGPLEAGDDGEKERKRQIASHYLVDKPQQADFIEYLKNIYNPHMIAFSSFGGRYYDEHKPFHLYDFAYNKAGLQFKWRDEKKIIHNECMKWAEVARRTAQLIESREYLDEDIAKNEVDNFEKLRIPRIDYSYSASDDIGAGGPKVKFQSNLEAIKLLKQIEDENRLATADEQKILCKYVGWGGLAEAFDPNNSSWSNEYMQLKQLLNENEYECARASTLCAHYTPPEVIQEIYTALENFGFKGGNVLDPAMGTALFFAAMPEEMKNNSRLYGYEIDELSGRIAKQLQQNADIRIQGFETTETPDNFFDVAIGNVPFGDYRLHDPKFNKHKFLIHDYFFAKALDKVRPGGVIAFITSKGTLDKENPDLRKYLGGRADLIGAVRLPNNTFRQMANTSVTTDIIFLQKRERIVSEEPYWVNIGADDNGIPVNAYYEENPYMMLGKMEYGTRYGENSTTDLIATKDLELRQDLHTALSSLHAVIPEYEREEENNEEVTIPADPDVRNFTYTFVEGDLFYRENSVMRRMNYEGKPLERITGMHAIREVTRKLIDAQTEDKDEQIIKQLQYELNEYYDTFKKKYGNINDSANERVFRDDSDYPLICSLEVYDDETKTYSKADMFTKRTIRPHIPITSVDTATDALRVSLAEKGVVDFKYMSNLYKNTAYADMYEELHGMVFINPTSLPHTLKPNMSIREFFEEYGEVDCLETADEYLSGDVRLKLKIAADYEESNPEIFGYNREKLDEVQPEWLEAGDIDVSIGVTWIENQDYTQFMYDVFQTPYSEQYGSKAIAVEYNRFANTFSVRNKSRDSSSVTVTETFGTGRKTAYEIFEDTLNMKSTCVYDKEIQEDGNPKYILNSKETLLAREKQTQIKDAFRNWIFEEPQRRKKYVDYYNETFNNLRLRKYDGSFLTFQGMTEDLELRWYQRNAVARGLLSNTCELLDHKVGAGKTFVMASLCMEMKRLGNIQKAIFVVPNHLTGQMGSEFLRLYPSAKILVTSNRDFEKKNRLKFVSKIATGEWDAVIIGHSQFERIAMSKERQIMTLQQQVAEIAGALESMSEDEGQGFTIRQMEKLKENLTTQIKELANNDKKDTLITFESLGIDYMFVDEAHYYKNCATFSKMRNVAGINQSRAKRATDMLTKCRYMQEINEGKGVVFATGTPISNSMSEMFVMQRFLDPRELENREMVHFDAWAAHFGEVVTSLELAPEGTGYRYRTRFAKFKNLPELMAMYHNFADVITDEDLDIPRPKIRGGEIEIVTCPPSDFTLLTMMSYVDRAKEIHEGRVKSWEDNMLKLTNEARHLATDIRLIDPEQENTPTSKVSMCADYAYKDYVASSAFKGTQIIFSDIGTPKPNGEFNVYDALKEELINRGVKEEDICFVHDAKTDAQREELFAKMRSGEKRIIIGSTNKLGVGTNIQTRVYSEHDIDCPYRPSDVEQRMGRSLRNGNINEDVAIRRYVSPNTFDAYMWQLVETKQRFIAQIKSGKTVQRTCEDIDEAVITYAELKAVASGDERIKEKMDIDLAISRLQMLKANYDNQRYALQDKFTIQYPTAIAGNEKRIESLTKDKLLWKSNYSEEFSIVVDGKTFTEREEAGKRIMLLAKSLGMGEKEKEIGEYSGFKLSLKQEKVWDRFETRLVLKGALEYTTDLSSSPHGNTVKLDNLLKSLDKQLEDTQAKLTENKKNMELAKQEYEKPFPHDEELKEKLKRQAELNEELDLNKQDEVVEEETDDEEESDEEGTTSKAAIDALPYTALEKSNYKKLMSMFPEVLNLEKSYMMYVKKYHDNLLVENVGGGEFSVSLYYYHDSGDRMYEPEYRFVLNREAEAARITEWQMSSLGQHQYVYDYDDETKYNPKLKDDLDIAFSSTLRDLGLLCYTPYNDEEESDEDEM